MHSDSVLIVNFPHNGFLRNSIPNFLNKESQIFVYCSWFDFFRSFEDAEITNYLCDKSVNIELPFIFGILSLKRSSFFARALCFLYNVLPLSLQEFLVYFLPKFNHDKLDKIISRYDKVGSIVLDSWIFETCKKNIPAVAKLLVNPSIAINVAHHGHEYSSEFLQERINSLCAQLSLQTGYSSSLINKKIVHLESVKIDIANLPPHNKQENSRDCIVYFRAADKYISEDTIKESLQIIAKISSRNGVRVYIKPHLWPNLKLLKYYLFLRYVKGLNLRLIKGNVNELVGRSFLGICFYCTIWRPYLYVNKPFIQIATSSIPPKHIAKKPVNVVRTSTELRQELEKIFIELFS
jgi:hypothetical protein